ncbi:MAG TPA: O-antigen ligase family protein [Burkholderiales bacterium]|nr:O-antigen ligase family protein [Burkholderiales bacterium]
MDITVSQYAQMIIAAFGGTLFFLLLFRLPERVSLACLILLIPFQLIDTRFGSVNTILVYVAAFAFLVQGRLTKVPFFVPILAVLFVFLLAFTQSPAIARLYHVIYLVGFFSNILLFYMVYNYLLRTQDWQLIIKCLIIVNILVAVYCAIQFAAGPTRVTFFGIQELSLNPIRNDGRLVGPFKATAATAEYLTFQCLLFCFLILFRPPRRLSLLIYGLVAVNLLFLIATGNRGGFVTIVFGTLLFLFAFRRELGLARMVKILIGGTTIFVALAIVAVNFTDYGMLFERLEGTEIEEGGVPDTRALVWPLAWAEIVKKPVIGHGPKLDISTREHAVGDIEYVRFPHNLLLHILYTTGAVGAAAWIAFFTIMALKLWTTRNASIDDRQLAALPKLGLVYLVVFFVSQLRIEFLRESLIDYQNYLFVLFAFFLATADIIRSRARIQVQNNGFGRTAPGAVAHQS